MKIISPMLAKGMSDEKLEKFFDNKDYICEEKYDGSRYILQFDGEGNPTLTSRRISTVTCKPVEKTENLMGSVCLRMPTLANTVLDGEIVVNGNFTDTVKVMGAGAEKAQNRIAEGLVPKYIIYDVLEFDGEDLRDTPWIARQGALQAIVGLSFNKHWELARKLDNTRKSFETILDEGGEGVILKKIDSVYAEGCRNNNWIKVKKIESFDAIVIGFKKGTGKYTNNVGALIVGQYFNNDKNDLREVATISGMTDAMRNEINENQDKYKGRVIEFLAQQKTKARYRHPRFVRFRDDKSKAECLF